MDPEWTCFVQTIHKPQNMIFDNFATTQEGAHKAVEDGLVLQAQWAVIQ